MIDVVGVIQQQSFKLISLKVHSFGSSKWRNETLKVIARKFAALHAMPWVVARLVLWAHHDGMQLWHWTTERIGNALNFLSNGRDNDATEIEDNRSDSGGRSHFSTLRILLLVNRHGR